MSPVDYRRGVALITGASSGLGEEFARRLAARGADLALVARRADRLDALAGRLRAEHGIAVTTIPLDLAAAGAAATLREETDRLGLDVHTLVNNAGFATHGRFEVADPDRIRSEIALNVATLVALSRAYIPDLVRHGDGALVNIASTAAYQPVPSMAVYSATKAFVLSFTEALWHETRGSGLRVLALSPGATRTEFFDVVGSENARVGRMQTAQQVVDLALTTLDRRNAPPSVISGTGNRVSAALSRLLSRRLLVNTTGRVMAAAEARA